MPQGCGLDGQEQTWCMKRGIRTSGGCWNHTPLTLCLPALPLSPSGPTSLCVSGVTQGLEDTGLCGACTHARACVCVCVCVMKTHLFCVTMKWEVKVLANSSIAPADKCKVILFNERGSLDITILRLLLEQECKMFIWVIYSSVTSVYQRPADTLGDAKAQINKTCLPDHKEVCPLGGSTQLGHVILLSIRLWLGRAIWNCWYLMGFDHSKGSFVVQPNIWIMFCHFARAPITNYCRTGGLRQETLTSHTSEAGSPWLRFWRTQFLVKALFLAGGPPSPCSVRMWPLLHLCTGWRGVAVRPLLLIRTLIPSD